MLISKSSYDVIIVGSGPAGATAAYFLAINGVKPLIIEKKRFPRYKTCGGGVVSRVKDLLPFDLDEVLETSCMQAEVYDKGSRLHFSSERVYPIIMMTMRENFDSFLLSKAIEQGAVLKDKCEVRDFKITGNGIEINAGAENFISKFVIAADGSNGIFSKRFNSIDDVVRLPALEYEIFTDIDTYARFCNKARFDFGFPENGYGWVFPKKDHLSVGVVGMTKINCNLNEVFSKYINQLRIIEILNSEKHGYTIPILKRKKVFNHAGILFTGDAAGFADPIIGEGISGAILSGRLAAESIISANFDEKKAAFLYNRAIYGTLMKEYRSAKVISTLIYNYPKLRSFLFRSYGQKIAEIITDIFSGKLKYSTLFNSPNFYYKLVKYYLINKMQSYTNKVNPSLEINKISRN
jgi:geranylgeranyl reductase family protein